MTHAIRIMVDHDPTYASSQPVKVRRADGTPSGASLEADLAIARRIATLLDAQFEVGGFRVGLDALLGLIPVAGDLLSLGIGMYPVHLARKHKLGRLVVLRMLGNLAVDFAIGAVPVLGDAADIAFKANLRNFRLLEEAARKRG
jgi:hypothetical protein